MLRGGKQEQNATRGLTYVLYRLANLSDAGSLLSRATCHDTRISHAESDSFVGSGSEDIAIPVDLSC